MNGAVVPPWETGKETVRRELEALRDLCDGLPDDYFHQAVELLMAMERKGGHVYVTGVGKPRHIAMKAAATLQSTGTKAHFLEPTDCVHGDSGAVSPGDVVVAISHSGRTAELLRCVTLVRAIGAPVVAIVGDPSSELARSADVVLHVPVATEAGPLGLAPTSSTLCQLAVADGLAMSLQSARGFTMEDFRRCHPGGSLGAQLAAAVSAR